MGTQKENEIAYKWRVSNKYWLEERQLTEEQYKQVILKCTSDNAGFCESCMGNTQCEIKVLGFEVWHNKVFPDRPFPLKTPIITEKVTLDQDEVGTGPP